PNGNGSVEPSDPGILVVDLDQPVTPPSLLDDATIPGHPQNAHLLKALNLVFQNSETCTERDVHLVLPGASQLGEKYISTMSYSGLFTQCSEEDVSVSVKCPDTVETVSRLITENEPFVLAPTSLRKLNEHSGNISEQERSMIRRDLVVVLRDLGRNTRLVYGKERRIFYHSKGLVTYYRQKLFKEVKKIKPQSKKKEKVQVPEFPMAVSFKLNEDGEECLVKCPICELQFERGSETYFSHLGRYHFNPYCEPRTFQQPNCGYSIEDGVDHFKHAHSHSNGTIPFEANGNIRFEAVEKSTYPKTGTALACWNPCPICLKNIATDNELQIHFVIIHCLSEILLHIPRKKDSTDTHLCPRIGCLEIFSDVWQLAMHLGIKHDLIRSWLKPIPKKDAIRCPLKNCLDRSVSELSHSRRFKVPKECKRRDCFQRLFKIAPPSPWRSFNEEENAHV
ncbi:hypothetical protein TCAL_01481, partial [Tigriopus californicus]